MLPARDVASDAHQHGWRGALREHRYDSGRYELIKALAEAVDNENARARFMARRQAFTFDADDAPEQADVAMSSNRPRLPAGHVSLADWVRFPSQLGARAIGEGMMSHAEQQPESRRPRRSVCDRSGFK